MAHPKQYEIKSGTDFMTNAKYVGIRTTGDVAFWDYSTGVKLDKNGQPVKGKFGREALNTPFTATLLANGFKLVASTYYRAEYNTEEEKASLVTFATTVGDKFSELVATGKVVKAAKGAPVTANAALQALLAIG